MESNTDLNEQRQSGSRILIPLIPIHIEFIIKVLELDLIHIDNYISVRSEKFENLKTRHQTLLMHRLDHEALNTAFLEEFSDCKKVLRAYSEILKVFKNGLEEARHVA